MYQSETEPSPNGATPGAVDEASKPANGNGFLAELAHAMQIAAEREHQRASADLDAAVQAHLERVRVREATEAGELRRMAEADVDEIHTWSKSEITRIREETARRISVRGNQLDDYLVRHAALTDDEVAHIDSTVTEYRVVLDRYFTQLANEGDPGEIARLADEMPEAPDLARIGGEARASALAAVASQSEGPAPVPVMEPKATSESKEPEATEAAADAPPAAAPTQRSLWQSIALWAAPPEPEEAKRKDSEAIGTGGPSAQG